MFHRAPTGACPVLWMEELNPRNSSAMKGAALSSRRDFLRLREQQSISDPSSWGMLLQSWPGRKRVKRLEETENCSGISSRLSACPVNAPTGFSTVRISPHGFFRKPSSRSLMLNSYLPVAWCHWAKQRKSLCSAHLCWTEQPELHEQQPHSWQITG